MNGAFKIRIQREAAVEKMSVGDLILDREYVIEKLTCITTQYGPSVIAVVKVAEDEHLGGGIPAKGRPNE
jgi:hypothetical protein